MSLLQSMIPATTSSCFIGATEIVSSSKLEITTLSKTVLKDFTTNADVLYVNTYKMDNGKLTLSDVSRFNLNKTLK